jgi:hypothetical protein
LYRFTTVNQGFSDVKLSLAAWQNLQKKRPVSQMAETGAEILSPNRNLFGSRAVPEGPLALRHWIAPALPSSKVSRKNTSFL